MSTLLQKIKSLGKLEGTSVLSESTFLSSESTKTLLPILNIALSAEIDGGFVPGIITIAGPSKHFKSSLSLFMVASFLRKHEDAICIFYDSEFGTPSTYFASAGIDPNRVLHIPIMNIEELKFDILPKLENLTRKDKVIILIDSVGNLASKKEVEDTLNEKSVADMTRAKQLKSFYRIITPYMQKLGITTIAIAHTYKSMDMYPKDIVSGGTGGIYSSNSIFIISRAKDADNDGLNGYKFTIKIEKSRFVKEESKLSFNVDFNKGINKWSGLLDLAIEFGFIQKSGAWYKVVDMETGVVNPKSYRASELQTPEILGRIILSESFKNKVKEKYSIGNGVLMQEEEESKDEEFIEDLTETGE